jgi:hypothetical protein
MLKLTIIKTTTNSRHAETNYFDHNKFQTCRNGLFGLQLIPGLLKPRFLTATHSRHAETD